MHWLLWWWPTVTKSACVQKCLGRGMEEGGKGGGVRSQANMTPAAWGKGKGGAGASAQVTRTDAGQRSSTRRKGDESTRERANTGPRERAGQRAGRNREERSRGVCVPDLASEAPALATTSLSLISRISFTARAIWPSPPLLFPNSASAGDLSIP